MLSSLHRSTTPITTAAAATDPQHERTALEALIASLEKDRDDALDAAVAAYLDRLRGLSLAGPGGAPAAAYDQLVEQFERDLRVVDEHQRRVDTWTGYQQHGGT
jgi:hypothetical protein